jgi:hypothetical protein
MTPSSGVEDFHESANHHHVDAQDFDALEAMSSRPRHGKLQSVETIVNQVRQPPTLKWSRESPQLY